MRRSISGIRTARSIASTLLACLGLALPAAAEPQRPAHIVVRYAAEGPHAVEACGVALHHRRDHRGATRDRSDSLDRLRDRFGVERVSALVEGEPGAGLEGRRARLRRALASGRPPAPRAASARAIAEPPADLAARIEALAHVYRLELPPGVSPREAAAAYADDPHVVWAQVDTARILDHHAPDPFLLSSGSWGQPYEDLWGFHRIRAAEAWDESTGEGVVVAVVDTGLDWHHPDIERNVFVHPGEDLNGNGRVDADEWNGVDDDGNGFVDDLVGFDFANSIDANGDGDYVDPGDVNDPDPFDDNGHGTHVAGIVAATADNGEGIAGVAPGARIMALKGFTADGANSDAILWRAVLYAAMNGAQVVNNSWSCGAPCPRNPLAEEVVDVVHALGVTIVTSAGNKSRDVAAFSPENSWQTITVGSSDAFDGPSLSFTNQGFGVDVMAPGGDPQDTPNVYVPRRNILSLRSSGGLPADAPFEVGPDYIRFAGTSMAAPQVAGVAALLYAQRPGISPDAVRRIIRRTAVDLDRPGHDWATGAGRLDAAAAVADPPEPDWLLRVTSPRAFDWFDPRGGVVEIRGTATGRDLRAFSVAVGQGVQPESWRVIATRDEPVEDGELAAWPVEPGTTGAWVVRVEAEAIDGRRATEFIPVSFERLRAELISSEGPEAERPAIYGRHVVWQSRRGDFEDRFGRVDFDLFEGGFGGIEERRLLAAPGDQTQPALSGDRRTRTYSWLSADESTRPQRAQACRLRGRGASCRPVDLGGAHGQSLPPVPVRDGVYWLERSADGGAMTDIAACRFEAPGGECVPIETGLAPRSRGLLDGDGRGTLVWTSVGIGQGIATCEVDWTGRCEEVLLPSTARAFSRPAASRDLVVWVAARFFGKRPLLACTPDSDGWCSPISIRPHAEDGRVRVSGDVVVWDEAVGDEPSDVFFCEFDRHLGRCPPQRLTSEGSVQDESDVDGHRVVWVDERHGPGRVAGVELPRWRPLGPRRARVGRPMRAIAWLDESGHGLVELGVETIRPSDGATTAIAPHVEAHSPRASHVPVHLEWCPSDADVGDHVFTLEAHMADGLTTRASFNVVVTSSPSSSIIERLRRLFGIAPRLRTCEALP